MSIKEKHIIKLKELVMRRGMDIKLALDNYDEVFDKSEDNYDVIKNNAEKEFNECVELYEVLCSLVVVNG